MKIIYVNQEDNRSWSTTPEAFEGLTYPVTVPGDFTGGAMTYNRITGEWVLDSPYEPTQADNIAAAEAQRIAYISEASNIIYDWAIDATTGDISEEDLASLKVWRVYIKKLKALDLDAAPDIEWPPKPEA